ncbi:MAG: hypothetical protein LBE36_06680 [Flavobacteriaceae bacterium]|jgi:Ca2+/Na+ antiporter|nr:hypothetical protein [Flavobacteriaceae bacterium]
MNKDFFIKISSLNLILLTFVAFVFLTSCGSRKVQTEIEKEKIEISEKEKTADKKSEVVEIYTNQDFRETAENKEEIAKIDTETRTVTTTEYYESGAVKSETKTIENISKQKSKKSETSAEIVSKTQISETAKTETESKTETAKSQTQEIKTKTKESETKNRWLWLAIIPFLIIAGWATREFYKGKTNV